MSLFNELKRRNVFKVSVAYIVMAWLVMQLADIILNNITAPQWVFHVVLLFLAIGLPFAVFFAWEFEMTPEGIKREHEVDRSQSIIHETSRKLDFIIIGVMAVALAYFTYDKLVLSAERDAALVEATTQAVSEQAVTEQEESAELDKSVAVLAFVNMSTDPEQEYFSDGIAEEILNGLAQLPDLKVAARTSAFSFKGKNIDIRQVGEMLNVNYVLEGSVRKAGDRLRITAQLISVEGGYHLWSETFNRQMDDIFAIQEEIARAIVDALEVTLGLAEEASLIQQGTTNTEAYNWFLRGKY